MDEPEDATDPAPQQEPDSNGKGGEEKPEDVEEPEMGSEDATSNDEGETAPEQEDAPNEGESDDPETGKEGPEVSEAEAEGPKAKPKKESAPQEPKGAKTEDSKPKKKATKGKGKKGKDEPAAKTDEDFKYIVRIVNTDLDGHRTVPYGLTSIDGVNVRIGHIITKLNGLDPKRKLGNLTDEEIEKLADTVTKIPELIPSWLLNRQHDLDTGDDIHLVSSDILTYRRDDLNRLKKIRSYRGIKHELGHKVRGQRSRSNGRSGLTLGVQKKRQQPDTSKKK